MQSVVATNKEGRASRAPAGTIERCRDYHSSNPASRGNLFGQAADILCLMSVVALSPVEEAACWPLFQRRLERAYGGASL